MERETSNPTSENGQTEESLSSVESLSRLDRTYKHVKCLGHGGFGSVFLAEKESGRQVALKILRIGLDDDQEEIHNLVLREVDAVLQLDPDSEDSSQHISIVHFEDWFRGPNLAYIVMNYANGGTLMDEIQYKCRQSFPYSERRIAWYALQLSEALAHAHSRGIFHFDVKSSNVLIDRSFGGKLMLADFGSAASTGSYCDISFSVEYAAPELQNAHSRNNFTGLEPSKIDAFGLGCILFELVCCNRIVDFAGTQTLGSFVQEHGSSEAALNLSEVYLPWLPQGETTQIGYSYTLQYVLGRLLDPNMDTRWAPSQLIQPLREDPASPLLMALCTAAEVLQPGAPLTIDVIQLGQFVQRGHDWVEGDRDGGAGSIGVVVKLDADAGYTEVAFPRNNGPPESFSCRIGANNKFELMVGPTEISPLGNECERRNGILLTDDMSTFEIGQTIDDDHVVVGKDSARNYVFIAPTTKIQIESRPRPNNPNPDSYSTEPRKANPTPSHWNLDLGLLVELDEGAERTSVIDMFYSEEGLRREMYEIVSVEAVQCKSLWDTYASYCEEIAQDNWGIPNESRLFHGTGWYSPEILLQQPEDFYPKCKGFSSLVLSETMSFSSQASFANNFCFYNGSHMKIVLSRVALGRVQDSTTSQSTNLTYHSSRRSIESSGSTMISTNVPAQAYPEYIITYKIRAPTSRVVQTNPIAPQNPFQAQRIETPTHQLPTNGRRRRIRGRRPRSENHQLQQDASSTEAHAPLFSVSANRSIADRLASTTLNVAVGIAPHNPVQVQRIETPTHQPPTNGRRRRNRGRRPRSKNHQLQRYASSTEAHAPLFSSFTNSSIAELQAEHRPASAPNVEVGARSHATNSMERTLSPDDSTTKACVVCLDRAVCHVLIPCGHPCLCEICATKKNLLKLKSRCPECRQLFHQAVKFYGRVVED